MANEPTKSRPFPTQYPAPQAPWYLSGLSTNYKYDGSAKKLFWNILLGKFDTSRPPCTHSLLPNLICALSNIVFTGALALNWQQHHPARLILILSAIFWSTIYHLSETKNLLPGFPYLRKYSTMLIQLDRLFAAILMVDVVLSQFLVGVNWAAVCVGLVGVVFGVVSNRLTGWNFVIVHSIWHNAAFLAVALL